MSGLEVGEQCVRAVVRFVSAGRGSRANFGSRFQYLASS